MTCADKGLARGNLRAHDLLWHPRIRHRTPHPIPMSPRKQLVLTVVAAGLFAACADPTATADRTLRASPDALLASGSGGGGGIPGDTFRASITYTEASCPLPASIRSDYLDITYCALGKFTSKPRDFLLRVTGHTAMAAGIVRELRATGTITLPCGTTATVSRWDQSSSLIISPPNSPNNLYTESGRMADVCGTP